MEKHYRASALPDLAVVKVADGRVGIVWRMKYKNMSYEQASMDLYFKPHSNTASNCSVVPFGTWKDGGISENVILLAWPEQIVKDWIRNNVADGA